MKRIHYFTLLIAAISSCLCYGQVITTLTLNSGVTSTTLTAPMAPGDSVILMRGTLPPACTVSIVSYTTVVVFNNVNDSVFCVIENMLNDNNQFTMHSASTYARIKIISWAMVGMNLVCYDSNGIPILYWLITNSNLITGFKESALQFNPKVYPNPINDVFSIDLKNQNASSFELKIYNHMGELVKQEHDINISESRNLNIANLSQGIYTLEILCNEKRSIQKIVKM